MAHFGRYCILIGLSLYLLAGIDTVPFHADEALHLMLAQDYAAYFVLLDPTRLDSSPPLAIDSTPYSRLLSGTVSAYTTGWMLWHSGQALEDWPQGWYFPQSVKWNKEQGRWPNDSVLWRGRLASSFFTVLGLWGIYTLGTKLRGVWVGMFCASLYALHPMILLNGRRVMQEGALICLSLLLILWAGRVLERPTFPRWLGLGVLGGIALAVKPTALLVMASTALGMVIWTGLQHKSLPSFLFHGSFASGVALFLFVLLTPAIWRNPPARMQLAAQLRAEALAGQAEASPDAYQTWRRRLAAMWIQPFPHQVQYYESPNFAEDTRLQVQIDAYQSSFWDGIALPAVLGMGLAGIGLISLVLFPKATPYPVLMITWVTVVGLALVVSVPMAWGRYYLPLTLPVLLLAGTGADVIRSCLLRDYPLER